MSFYGWRIVWAFAISTTAAYGVLYYSFAVFVQPMEQELGWNRAQTSLAFSLSALVGGLVAPLLGRWLDRYGARAISSLGAGAASLLLLGWSYTSSLEVLYALWFLLGVCTAATFYDAAFTTIAVWFKQQRTEAMLTITLVAGLSSTIFVPLDTLLLEIFDWRGAIRVLALLMFLTAPLIWLVVRHHPSDVGSTVDGLPIKNAVQTPQIAPVVEFWRARAFWSVALAFALGRVAVSVLAPHLVPLLRERGYSSAFAATAAGAVGVLQLFGRVMFSSFIKRVRLVLLSSVTFLLHGLGVLFLTFQTDWGVWGFALFYGATNGAITLTRAALLGELFAPNVYGRVNGTVSLLVSLSSAFAPFVAGLLHNQFGDYQVVLWGIVAALLVSSGLVLNVHAKSTKPEPNLHNPEK
ncbi:MAG: MFS transporter [Deinococcales bacterium]